MSSGRLWLAIAGACAAAGPTLAQAPPDQPAPAAAKPATDKPAAAAKAAPAAKTPAKPASGKTVDTLTVTGGRPDVDTSQIDRKSYTLGKDLQAQTGSIADALRNLPSVDVDVQGNLSLRGDPNVTILVDGKPAPQFEGKGRADALQQLPADQIERVEVITNPSAALTPEGSGVINLITKKSRGAGRTGSVYVTAGSAGLKRAGGSFGYNSPRLSITGALAGNYQRNKTHGHDVRIAIDPASGAQTTSTNDFIGRNIARGPTGNLNATFTPSDHDRFTGAYTYNELLLYGHPADQFETVGPTGLVLNSQARQGQRRFEEIDTGYTGGWKHTFAENHELSVDLIHNQGRPRDHIVYATLAAQPAPAFAIQDTRDHGTVSRDEVHLVYTRPTPGHGKLTLGYEFRSDDNVYTYHDFRGSIGALVDQLALANDYTYRQNIHSAYATYERTFGDLGLQAGVRVEDVSFRLHQYSEGVVVGQDYVKAYPSLHLSYRLDDDSKLTAAYTHRVQRPNSIFLNPRRYVYDVQNTQIGNPDLNPADTTSYELGYQRKWAGQDLQANLFYRDNKDEFTQALIPLGGGLFETTFLNEGSSEAVGLELNASGRISPKLSYNAGVTPYWAQVNAGDPAFGGARSVVTVQGRASLNWQATGDDLLQLQANGRGRVITAQGFFEPVWTLNFGWRHKLSDRMNLTLTGQDLLASNRFVRNFDTPTLEDHFVVRPVTRAVFLRLDYRFGGGNGRPQQDFQYDTGGAGPGH
jgi:outer membrane receptor protein involved in Fe transport